MDRIVEQVNQRVYVVCKGEYGEGHSPITVVDSWASAASIARRTVPKVTKESPNVWKGTADNGVDQVWIYRFRVNVPQE